MKYAQLVHVFENLIHFNRLMGLKAEELQEGYARVRLPFRDDFLGDPVRKALHGGVTSFLVDVTGGLAVFTQLPPQGRCSTVDMRVDYLHPGSAEDLVGEARVVRMGNRVAVANVDVRQRDTLIAQGRAVYNLHQARHEAHH